MPAFNPTPYEQIHGMPPEKLRANAAHAHLALIASAGRPPLEVKKALADLAAANEALDPGSKAKDPPAPVHKAKKTPMLAVYDDAGGLVGALDPAKLHKVSKSGDEAVMNAVGTVIGYANAKDVRPLRSLSAGAAKPKPAAPARTAVPTAPASATVQKANAIVRSRNATREQIRWAVDILDRLSVRKAATKPAAPQGKLVYRYVDGKLVSKAIER